MEIPQLKAQLDIIEVARHLGIYPDKHGKANCPFHEDGKPSLQFSRSKQICTCFSSNCDAGTMDVISLTQKYLGLSTHETLKYLTQLAEGATLTTPTQPPSMKTKADYAQDFQVMKSTFIASSTARSYAESRKLDWKKLDLGYNAFKNGRFAYLKGCITFPLKDESGQTVSLYGRSISDNGRDRHFYTPDRKGLYPGYPEKGTEKLILTESVIDAATLLSVPEAVEGYEVLALYGTNGLRTEHVNALQKLNQLEEIILFLDGDKAGKIALQEQGKYLKSLFPEIKLSFVQTPEDEDINSLVQGHEKEVFAHLLKNRKGFFLSPEPLKGTENNGIGTKEQSIATPEQSNIKHPTLNINNPNHLTYQKGHLKASILGGINLAQFDRLRVTILLEKVPKLNPLYSLRQSGLDLYNDGQVEKFIRTAANKLESGSSEIRLLIAELIDELEAYRLAEQAKKRPKQPKKRSLDAQRKQKALDYLKAPDLMKRTNRDIGKSGMIGEEINRLLMYLVFTSRLRESPLHLMSLGASGTGKTFLQERIVALIPEEDIIHATSLSENALYYFGLRLAHKLIVVEDLEGAMEVLYQIRELISKQELYKLVVMKNKQGRFDSEEVHTRGPICFTGTTTQEKLYEDNANRCLLLYLDNSREQQERIMAHQRAVSAGKVNKVEAIRMQEFFKDKQSLLKPIAVVNPYAEQLNIPPEVFKPLRGNGHYLQFIECVTFYHQYQREIKQDKESGECYIETTIEDIAWANYLVEDVLLAKSDELSGACRKFFERLKGYLKQEEKASFYGKQIRQAFRMSPTTLKRHLLDLQRYGYLKIVGGNKHRQGYEYEVVDTQEYENLKKKVKNALDEALEQIKRNQRK